MVKTQYRNLGRVLRARLFLFSLTFIQQVLKQDHSLVNPLHHEHSLIGQVTYSTLLLLVSFPSSTSLASWQLIVPTSDIL